MESPCGLLDAQQVWTVKNVYGFLAFGPTYLPTTPRGGGVQGRERVEKFVSCLWRVTHQGKREVGLEAEVGDLGILVAEKK